MSISRLVFSLLFGCYLLIGASMVVGHALPAPSERSALARNPCTLPCFFGVTPGLTTRAEAIAILTRTEHASVDNAALISFSLLDAQGRASLASVSIGTDGLVDSVRLMPVDLFANTGQLSDLLLSGQQPAHIYHTCNDLLPIRFLITFGAHNEIVAEVYPYPFGSLAPDSRVTFFDLSTPDSRSLYDATSSFGCSVQTNWLGLAPIWKYFTSASVFF